MMAFRLLLGSFLVLAAIGSVPTSAGAQDFDDLNVSPLAVNTRGGGQSRGPGGMSAWEEPEARDVASQQAAFDSGPVRIDFDLKASVRIKLLWIDHLLSTGAGLKAQSP